MEVRMILPPGRWDEKISAVYRVDFNNGWFYIGSSTHLRNRFCSWNSFLMGRNTKSGRVGKNVIDRIGDANQAIMTILEICEGARAVLKLEAEYLKRHESHPFLLNVQIFTEKPVGMYAKDGSLLQSFNSIKATADFFNTKIYRIQRVLSGERKSYNGMYFKLMNTENSVKRVDQKTKGNRLRLPVEKMDAHGCVLCIYNTVAEAAKESGTSRNNIKRVLIGKQRTAAGFYFKYVQ